METVGEGKSEGVVTVGRERVSGRVLEEVG